MADGAAHYQNEVIRLLDKHLDGLTFAELRAMATPYLRVDHYRAVDRALQALRKKGSIRLSGRHRRGPVWERA